MYDANNVKPAFPFGHGLSYTTFEYSGLTFDVDTLTAVFTIKNTGSVYGAEVAQLYLGFPASAGEPPKVLRGFRKVTFDCPPPLTLRSPCALTPFRSSCRPAKTAS
jgi:beta-glucosidase